MKLFKKHNCTKNGQIEKEVDFKLLLKIVCGFIHKISTKAVEKRSDNFLSAYGILWTWINLWMILACYEKSSDWQIRREFLL
jgi:hypothetical protein